jgi:Skp family chaperone for outer membrane proteins
MIFSNIFGVMKKQSILFLIVFIFSNATFAQTGKGARIGYIDMEYILENVPDYAEAKNQLDQKTQKWKKDIEVKKNEIAKLKETLKTERVLLTKELVEEREEAIAVLEKDMFDYQQNRFGPTGDLTVQKGILIKPIQDQVFTAVQDLAEAKKYDFIFDKSSDLTILFAAKRYDVSDQIVRKIVNASKREQLTKKELEREAIRESLLDAKDENPANLERKKKLEEKNQERLRIIEERKAAREAKKNGVTAKEDEGDDTKETPNTDQLDREAQKKAATEARLKDFEDRKKALADRKAQIVAEREAAKKAKEEEKAKQQQANTKK